MTVWMLIEVDFDNQIRAILGEYDVYREAMEIFNRESEKNYYIRLLELNTNSNRYHYLGDVWDILHHM